MFLIICKNAFLSNMRNTFWIFGARATVHNAFDAIFMNQIRPQRLHYQRKQLSK